MLGSRGRVASVAALLLAVITCTNEPTNPAASAAKVAFTVQPGAVTAGAAISPAIQVAVQDAQGRTVTTSTVSVTLALASGTGTAGAHLRGTATVRSSGGVATFSGLSVDSAGTGYTLTATATGLTSDTSDAFSVTAGTASKLVFTVQPSDVPVEVAISPAIKVSVQDTLGNLVTDATTSVTLAIGTNPAGGTLSGTATVVPVSGVATFSDLSIDRAGTGYRLTATSGLTSATSAAFNVTAVAGAAAKLAFVVQPSNATAGAAITPAVHVAIEDASGNTVTSAATSVTVAIASGTGKTGAHLRGTATVSAVSGIASFPALSVDSAATNYQLTATASALTTATSGAFAVSPGPTAKLAWVVQPDSLTVVLIGNAITPAPVVAVEDSLGNVVASATVNIKLRGGGSVLQCLTIGGDTAAATVNGLATFPNVAPLTMSCGASLIASAPGLPLAQSDGFQVMTFTSVSVGGTTACGVARGYGAFTTNVYCWGANGYGQLGDGANLSRDSLPAPVSQTVEGNLIDVSVGLDFACGTASPGDVYCWGYNADGELGDGSFSNSNVPEPVSNPHPTAGGGNLLGSASAGGYQACSLGYCWGVVGFGVSVAAPVAFSVPLPPSDTGFLRYEYFPTDVSAGFSHTCAVMVSNEGNNTLLGPGPAYCWGANDAEQLGSDSVGNLYDSVPVPVSGGLLFDSVTAGAGFSCGLTSTGAAYCWGDNQYGELGGGANGSPSPMPTLVSGHHIFTSVSAGSGFACGIDALGTAYCWGDNTGGQLGDSSTAGSPTPVPVSGGLRFVSVSAGYGSACGITTVGIFCWGDNSYGELGNGSSGGLFSGFSYSTVPVRVSNFRLGSAP